MVSLIGLFGLICIVFAWIPQTVKTVRNKRSDIGLPFLILYILGSFSLTVYSVLLNDIIFMILNGLATFESAINLYYKAKSH
jgi:MtN3 and saliva related transmembrane protein